MRMSMLPAIWSLCAAAFLPLCDQVSAGEQIEPAAIQRAAQASFPEFLEFLSLPNDAVSGADIQKNADWLETAFRKRGFKTRQLANKDKPLVFAEYSRKIENARTILFYMHFDGQPVVPEKWAQASPWVPAVKRLKLGAAEQTRQHLAPSRPRKRPMPAGGSPWRPVSSMRTSWTLSFGYSAAPRQTIKRRL
jgi:hypothetical protein